CDRFNPCLEALRPLLAAGCKYQAGAFARKQPRRRLADPGGGAGHYHHLAVELTHGSSPRLQHCFFDAAARLRYLAVPLSYRLDDRSLHTASAHCSVPFSLKDTTGSSSSNKATRDRRRRTSHPVCARYFES